jgi:hypothetical protein
VAQRGPQPHGNLLQRLGGMDNQEIARSALALRLLIGLGICCAGGGARGGRHGDPACSASKPFLDRRNHLSAPTFYPFVDSNEARTIAEHARKQQEWIYGADADGPLWKLLKRTHAMNQNAEQL